MLSLLQFTSPYFLFLQFLLGSFRDLLQLFIQLSAFPKATSTLSRASDVLSFTFLRVTLLSSVSVPHMCTGAWGSSEEQAAVIGY